MWRFLLAITFLGSSAVLAVVGLRAPVVAPDTASAISSSAQYFFHGTTSDDANRLAGNPTATFDGTAPSGSSDIAQTSGLNGNANQAADPPSVYWISSAYTGPINGSITFDWYWSSTTAISDTVTITVYADVDLTNHTGTKIGQETATLLLGMSPTLNHTSVDVIGTVHTNLLVQVTTGTIATAHYDSTATPSSFSIPFVAPSEWSIVPSPSLTSHTLPGTSCVSASDCWAVGSYFNVDRVTQTLIEHWDGATWSVVPSPNASTTQRNVLSSVFCNSATDCWAVGSSRVSPTSLATLIEHWDGNSWSIVTSPAGGTYLYSVTCASASDCWAVGYYKSGATNQPLVEHWNGSAWSIQPAPTPSNSGSVFNYLHGVFCNSSTDCWAVGRYEGVGSRKPLTEHWDGSTWTIVAAPYTASNEDNYLDAVTCVSSSSCWAVGHYEDNETDVDQTLVEYWNGASWTIASAPPNNSLSSVSCAAANDCWAVGYFYGAGSIEPLVEHWNGTSWTTISLATDPAETISLATVTCTSASRCVALGISGIKTFALAWNGSTWSVVPSANNPGAGADNKLNAIDCATASDCWTVGTYYPDNAFYRTLIEHWNGVAWSVITSPNTAPAVDNLLADVSCAGSSACWAVGGTGNGDTLIERWNGSSWSIVTAPGSPRSDFLHAVDCVSANDCWAAGDSYYYDPDTDTDSSQTLLLHWNGTLWSNLASPNSPHTYNYFYGLECTSATDCWAVGRASDSSVVEPLIAHWNGLAWTMVAGAPVASSNAYFEGVTCLSSADCWAAGRSLGANNHWQTLIEHWNGGLWTQVISPNTGNVSTFLTDVACASSSNCWASGSYLAIDGFNGDPDYYQTLIEHWDGNAWSITSSPNRRYEPFILSNTLAAIACVSASQCWSVGSAAVTDAQINQTLIEQFVPLPTIRITSATRLANGRFSLSGQTKPVLSIQIQAGDDLNGPFVTIGSTTADANGAFEFEDVNAASFSKRFYRASY